jgi:hypothetical protein
MHLNPELVHAVIAERERDLQRRAERAHMLPGRERRVRGGQRTGARRALSGLMSRAFSQGLAPR